MYAYIKFLLISGQANRHIRISSMSMWKRRKRARQAGNAGLITGFAQKAYLCHLPISTRKLNFSFFISLCKYVRVTKLNATLKANLCRQMYTYTAKCTKINLLPTKTNVLRWTNTVSTMFSGRG